MAITRPTCFTSISDKEVAKDRPVTEELVRKMVQNCNMLGALAPIGSVRHVQLNLPGVEAPDSTILQMCDGSEIVQENSPLKTTEGSSKYTPDMRKRYVRAWIYDHYAAEGGQETINISHTHVIDPAYSWFRGIDNDSDLGGYAGEAHTHSLSSALSATEDTNPGHMQLAVYLKIN